MLPSVFLSLCCLSLLSLMKPLCVFACIAICICLHWHICICLHYHLCIWAFVFCLLHLQWSLHPLFDIRPPPLILFRLERFQSKIQILLRTNPPFTATTTALQTSCILRAWCLSFCKTSWKCTIQGNRGATHFILSSGIYQPWLLPRAPLLRGSMAIKQCCRNKRSKIIFHDPNTLGVFYCAH